MPYFFLILVLFLNFSCQSFNSRNQFDKIFGCWKGNYDKIIYKIKIREDKLTIEQEGNKSDYVILYQNNFLTINYGNDEYLLLDVDSNNILHFRFPENKIHVDVPLIVEIDFYKCEN